MNYEYENNCTHNETIMDIVIEFTTKFNTIGKLLKDEKQLLRNRGFRDSDPFPEMCESKRNVARTITTNIQSIADFCVTDARLRKKFVLNTLLLLDTTLDFMCSLNQSLFEDIYEWHSERCFDDNIQQLRNCQRKSFDFNIIFWVPTKLPSILELLNAAICK